jgi:hypothetical protein
MALQSTRFEQHYQSAFTLMTVNLKLTVLLSACLLLGALITGCANKTVYLFNTGYPPASLTQVTEQLVLLGYDVQPVDAEIPPEFSDTAIATNPVFSAPNDLLVIEKILVEQVLPTPKYYQFAQGNHFYSTKSIGLYLRNGYQKIMPPVMSEKSCKKDGKEIDATFEFFKTGEVRIELEIYINREFVEGSEQILNGKYRLVNDSIQFEFAEFSTSHLPIKQVTVQTHFGERQADHLVFHSKQNNTLIEGCLFEAIYD